MTAAAPLDLARPARPESDPRRLRELLADAAVELVEHRAALAGAVELLAALCLLTRERPADHVAERRILGALLVGRATLRDVARLVAGDFDGAGHSWLFAVICSSIETRRIPGAGVAFRGVLEGRCRAVLERFPVAETDQALAAMRALPWPKGCPRDEIETVRALGAWRRGPEAMPQIGFKPPTCAGCGATDTLVTKSAAVSCWRCGYAGGRPGDDQAGRQE